MKPMMGVVGMAGIGKAGSRNTRRKTGPWPRPPGYGCPHLEAWRTGEERQDAAPPPNRVTMGKDRIGLPSLAVLGSQPRCNERSGQAGAPERSSAWLKPATDRSLGHAVGATEFAVES